MLYPYSEGSGGNRVLSFLRSSLSENRLYIKPDRHIVFVCGGDKAHVNLRSNFLKYAETHLSHIRIILAEDAYGDLMSGSTPQFVNLAIFEDLLADISDCIVLFPESPGSYAELGFFAAKKRIASKVLTVNNHAFQADDSFINLGPIAIFNDHSSYRPTLHVDYQEPDFDCIKKRLKRFDSSKRREAFSYQEFASYSRIHRFFATFEVIRLLRIIHVATLPYTLKFIFGGEVEPSEVKNLVSILVAARYVQRVGEENRYLVASSEVREFLDLPFQAEILTESNLHLLKFYKELYVEFLSTC